jgi:hypothetical protein
VCVCGRDGETRSALRNNTSKALAISIQRPCTIHRYGQADTATSQHGGDRQTPEGRSPSNRSAPLVASPCACLCIPPNPWSSHSYRRARSTSAQRLYRKLL